MEMVRVANSSFIAQINTDRERLVEKAAIVHEFKQEQLETHKNICSLRQQIKSLQV